MNKKRPVQSEFALHRSQTVENLYNEKGRPPYPYKSAKSRDLCVAFCTSQGRGAPLVRWPDGHTFFGPVAGRPYFLCFSAYNRPGAGAQYGSGGSPPARERSMGAEALRQPLAKTRKSGLSHFFDTLRGEGFPSDCYDRSRLLKISAPIKEKTTAAAIPPAVAVRPPVKTPRNPRWAMASFTPSAMV